MFESLKRRNYANELSRRFELEALPLTGNLFRVAMYLKRDRDEAEDLVQETLMEGLKSFHRYSPGTNIKAWLTTIMYNTHYKQLKKSSRLQLMPEKEDMMAQTAVFEPPVPVGLTDEVIIEALNNLPENFRVVVLFSDVEEFSYKEIAKILELPMGTVMSRLHRGRKLLRNELTAVAREFGILHEVPEFKKKEGGNS
ncbi:MAG: sigma-70 family RNA polymerase sigma factor [Pyrinomonadaceae bacterium]